MPRARHRLHEPLEVYWSLWIWETRIEPWAEKRSWGADRASVFTAAKSLARRIRPSGQPDDLAVLVDVDVFGRRSRRETGHGAHVAADGIDEPGPDRRTDLADR